MFAGIIPSLPGWPLWADCRIQPFSRAVVIAQPMLRIYFNGKFTAQRVTGVQRVAINLIRALDADPDIPAGQFILLCPPGGTPPALQRIQVRRVGFRGLPLHLWEQVVLPLVAARGLLVNLAGAAPYFGRRQACLIHDAAVFDWPGAYARGFVAWYRLLFLHLAQTRALLLTVSEHARGRLALHLGVPVARIGIVRNGGDHLDGIEADDRILLRHGLTTSRYLLAVGSVNPTKNLDALVEAYGRLPFDAERRLVIVGGLSERVFASAGVMAVAPGVERIGTVSDGELKALYRDAAALVFPSLYEGFGLPPLEAMACGCPVAAARAAAIPEVCGDAALYFDPTDLDAIAQAIASLWNDLALGERLRVAGRVRAHRAGWTVAAASLWRQLNGNSAATVAPT